jgi:cellulose biosynthesis protein BcsQ
VETEIGLLGEAILLPKDLKPQVRPVPEKTQALQIDQVPVLGAYDPLIPRKLMEGLCGCSTNYLVKFELEGLITPLKVKRGGLDVVVYRVTDVQKVLERRGVSYKKKQTAEVIACWSQKGGVGKSFTVQHLGAVLSLIGKKTLVIDLDSQGDVTNLFDCGKKHQDLLTNEEDLDPTIAELMDWSLEDGGDAGYQKLGFKDVVKHLSPTLDIIPADLDLGEINYSLNRLKLSERFFADGTAKIPPELYMVKDVVDQVKHLYDFILFDCPPNIETLNVGALLACTKIIIPLEMEAKSILTIRRNETFLKRLQSMHPGFQWEKILVVPNKYKKENIKMKAYSTLHDIYKNSNYFQVSGVTLPASVVVDRCSYTREPIFSMASKHGKEFKSIVPLAKEFTNYFWALAHEILDIPLENLLYETASGEV